MLKKKLAMATAGIVTGIAGITATCLMVKGIEKKSNTEIEALKKEMEELKKTLDMESIAKFNSDIVSQAEQMATAKDTFVESINTLNQLSEEFEKQKSGNEKRCNSLSEDFESDLKKKGEVIIKTVDDKIVEIKNVIKEMDEVETRISEHIAKTFNERSESIVNDIKSKCFTTLEQKQNDESITPNIDIDSLEDTEVKPKSKKKNKKK